MPRVFELGEFLVVERAEHIEPGLGFQSLQNSSFIPRKASLIFLRPSSSRVLMVPSGMPVLAAISRWLMPW